MKPEDRLGLTLFKLNALLDFATDLKKDSSPDHLLTHFQKVIENDLNIDRILYFFKLEDEWRLLLKANCTAEQVSRIDIARDLLRYTRTTTISSLEGTAISFMDVVIPIVKEGVTQAIVLLGDSNDSGKGVSPIVKHLSFAETISSISYLALENYYMVLQALKEKEMHTQLEVAAQLQRMLIAVPERIPKLDHVEIKTLYKPYYEVGGDYFDALRLDEHTIGFCMADVSGKGVPAALLMTNFQAHFRARMNPRIGLDEIIRQLNCEVSNVVGHSDLFITIFIARYSELTNKLEYVNAGQNPPYLWNIKKQTSECLQTGCTVLGVIDDLPFVNARTIELHDPCILLCYTDGLVECRRGGKDLYDTTIIEDLLPREETPSGLVNAIEEALYRGKEAHTHEVFDDVSIMALRFDPQKLSA